jgi:hypothetical protein
MLISMTLGVILAIIVGLITAAIFYYLLKTLKAGQKAGVITGLIFGLIAGVMLVMMAGRVIVVKSQEDTGTYLVYGSPTYEFSNGYKLNLTMESLDSYVINDSDLELVMEEVVYSTYGLGSDSYDILIKPMSITKMNNISVDYYFSDIPPDEIEISEGSSSASRFWLRTRESYENEYGELLFDPDVKSILAQPHTTANDGDSEED